MTKQKHDWQMHWMVLWTVYTPDQADKMVEMAG